MAPSVATVAIVTKLVRVCMLAPVLLLMSAMPSLRVRAGDNDNNDATGGSGSSSSGAATTRNTAPSKPPIPWFALGFVSVAALNSVVTLDRSLVKLASTASATVRLGVLHPPHIRQRADVTHRHTRTPSTDRRR